MADAAPRVRDLLRHGAARLRQSESETPDLDVAVLLAHSLGISRAALYARSLDLVPNEARKAFSLALEQRARGIPVAYLTGTKEFLGLALHVTPAVLVPRPESELLAEWAIRWLAARRGRATVVDVGTGSGAIAVSVAKFAAPAAVIASDRSLPALRVARSNGVSHGVERQVGFICGDLLHWLGQPVDLILANLPYLQDDQADSPSLAAEPQNALVGGGCDGFDLYRALLPQAAERLARGGALAFEIDPSQVTAATALCAEAFPHADVVLHDDLAGLARFVTVNNPSP